VTNAQRDKRTTLLFILKVLMQEDFAMGIGSHDINVIVLNDTKLRSYGKKVDNERYEYN